MGFLPADGATGGLRYEVAASGLLTFAAGIAYAQTTAYYFDPLDTLAPRRGPVNNDLVLADAGIQASLTGGKTWHGFQPYIGGTLGIVIGSPEFGVRWYPARRFSVELSYRVVFYKLQYPFSYRPTLIPLNGSLSQATAHPWATVGIGWTF